jgi:hypothetical protein
MKHPFSLSQTRTYTMWMVAAILSAMVPPASAAPLRLHASSGATTGTAVTSLQVAVSPSTAGNTLIGLIFTTNSNTVTSVVDSAAQTYHMDACYSVNQGELCSFSFANTVAGVSWIKATFPSSIAVVYAAEYSGLLTSNSFDKSASASATATTFSSGSTALSQSSEVLLGLVGSTTGSSQSFAASGGWSKILDTVDASDGDDSMYSDQVVNSAAAVANTGTCASGTAYSAAIFSYKAVTAITITPTSFAFGSVTAGGASTPTTFTVKNGGTTTIAGLSIASPNTMFAETNTCTTSLAAAATCTISVTFKPTTASAQTGQIQASYTGVGSPASASVTGTGLAPITITPASAAFGSVNLGTTSPAQTLTVKNNTTTTMPIAVSSSNTEFAETGCTTSLLAGASCTLSVTFTPSATASGVQSGNISVAYTGIGTPQSTSLTGTPVNPAFTAQPTSIAFSTTLNVGTPSAAHNVTINNKSKTAAVTIQSVVTSPAAYAITANTCGTSIAASSSCVVTVVFTPAVVGAAPGTLTVTAAGIPALVVPMTGGGQIGNLVSLAVTAPNASIAAGTSEQLTATGTYGSGAKGNVTAVSTWTSSNSLVATVVSTTGVATGVGGGSAVITATATGSSGTPVKNTVSVLVTGKVVTSVTVAAPLASIYPLGTDQFTATAKYSDGTTGPVAATFASSNTAVAAINSTTGLATGVLSAAGGTTNITATVTGVPVSPAFILTVPGVKSVSTAPAAGSSLNIFPLATSQFVATLNYTDGTTGVAPANSVTFASSNAGVATITSTTGLATGVLSAAGGTTNITANMTGILATPAALNVYGVKSVTVTPANPTFPLGLANSTLAFGPTNNSVPFTATATYTDPASTTVNVTSTATWLSSATTVATINTAGTATVTVPAGSLTTSNVTSTITATYAVPGTTLLTVQPPQLELLAVCLGAYPSASCGTSTTSVGATLGLNATQQFSAAGTYSDGSTQNLTSLATWAAATPQEVNVNSAGLATVVATDNAAHAITASYGTIAAYLDSDTGWITASTSAPISCPSPTIDMKILVVNNAAANAGAGYADFPAIQQILNYVGTPYEVVDVSATAPTLSDGACHGYFQGVIFAYGGDYYDISAWQSNLISYERTFNVRQVNWYDAPDPNFGLSLVSTIPDTETYTTSFTTAAAPIFFYANTATPLTITNASVDLAAADAAAGGTLTPLLQDASGNIASATYTYNGQQFLTQTFDSNPYLTHDLVVAYGLLNWVTKGVFLGDYHVYATQEIDDFFINDSEWIPSTTCLTNLALKDRTLPDASNLPVFRVDAADMAQLVAWQTAKQADPLFSPGTTYETGATSGKFELTIAMNGVGTSGNGDWTGLAAPIVSSSASGGLATFTAQDFSGQVGRTVTVANTTNGGGALNGTWTIVSVSLSAATTPGTNTFTATPVSPTATPGTLATAVETGADDNPQSATVTVADDLVTNLQSYQQYFHWISHTYDHPTTLNGLCASSPTAIVGTCAGDIYDSPAIDDINLEILTNLYTAGNASGVNLDTDTIVGPYNDGSLAPLLFTDFAPGNIVTPGVTGLNDPNVPGYLFADGIRYAVSDTSVATTTVPPNNNGPNPSPNVGIINSYEPGIYEVPRHPNDVFYNVANWADDDTEFVCIYSNYVAPTAPPGTSPAPDPPFNTYNAAQVLDFTSTAFVNNMLMGDMDPEMFHQPDLHFSDNYANLTNPAPSGTIPASVTSFLGTATSHVSSLISDTYDLTFSKYEAVYKLPVLTPTLDQMGVLMQNRNSFNLAGVTASISAANTPQAQITITMPAATSTSPATAIIPVTGLTSTGSEVYGGQNISHITITPGKSITFPLP